MAEVTTPAADTLQRALSPVAPARTAEEERPPEKGIALCLSGGGYRAMLFHVGAIWRLNEAGVLGLLKRVSSVSGGSITAGVLGLHWADLKLSPKSPTAAPDLFDKHFVTPLMNLANRTIDVRSVIFGALLPGKMISDMVADAYDKYLFGKGVFGRDATLQDLPGDSEGPRFVINSTNVQTGSLWRFSKPYMADYQVGTWSKPKVKLSKAVAASSAFPPVLSPCLLDLDVDPDPIPAGEKPPVHHEAPYTHRAVLSDGGVYDNLGLETAYKRYTTLLVSDGGMKMSGDPEPHEDWGLHAKRILDVIDNQVRSLRKHQLIHAFETKDRRGTYWGIATNPADYGLVDDKKQPINPFNCLDGGKPRAELAALAAIPTRLAGMSAGQQQALINWGYIMCDVALRSRTVPADLKAEHGIDITPGKQLPFS